MAHSDYALTGFRRMVQSDLQGGSLRHNGLDYDCTVGSFDIQQVLTSGGFAPMLLGTVMVAFDDLPLGLEFTRSQNIVVTPNTGSVRHCQVYSTKDLGPLVEITLRDANQGA